MRPCGANNMPIIASWDKLTSKAKQAVQAANYLASKRGNPELMPLHLLASLLADREGMVVPVLSKIGVDSQAALAEHGARSTACPRFGREAP